MSLELKQGRLSGCLALRFKVQGLGAGSLSWWTRALLKPALPVCAQVGSRFERMLQARPADVWAKVPCWFWRYTLQPLKPYETHPCRHPWRQNIREAGDGDFRLLWLLWLLVRVLLECSACMWSMWNKTLSQPFMPLANIPKAVVLAVVCFFAQRTAKGCLTFLEQDTLSQAFIPLADITDIYTFESLSAEHAALECGTF